MGEYGGHVPKRIQTEPVATPLIHGHLPECLKANEIGDLKETAKFMLSCPGCLKTFLKLFKEPINESPPSH
jgi:hypothetical protein